MLAATVAKRATKLLTAPTSMSTSAATVMLMDIYLRSVKSQRIGPESSVPTASSLDMERLAARSLLSRRLPWMAAMQASEVMMVSLSLLVEMTLVAVVISVLVTLLPFQQVTTLHGKMVIST